MKCISISHKNSTTKQREIFAFNDEEIRGFYDIVKSKVCTCGDGSAIDAIILLMTCNRSEIYYSGNARYEDVERMICDIKGISIELFRDISMRYGEGRSIKHLYRVVCGLDSAVLGEVEIIRQVKQAYLAAKDYGVVNTELNMIFQGALHLAKEMAEKSLMTRLPVSVGTLTTSAIMDFCADTKEPHILIIGVAGEMGSIVMKDVLDACKDARVIGTSRKHREELVRVINSDRVSWVHYDRRYEFVEWADVIVSVTNSPHYTFLAGNVKKVRASATRQLYLDLAVPRDIDEDIAKLDGCIVRNIDYIKGLAKDNNDKKMTEAARIDSVILERVDEMKRVLALRGYIEAYGDEVERLDKKSAMWLIYKLKDELDYETFAKVLDTVKEDI